ncbi:DUF6049 family protein [Planotetraspora kaengkrachanensis]|uniref:Secreted protein n=1 Tax=Planotetraspora kaengkrachanensis TaxID=575193 RepID=A0A8J3PU68_9ACTN|nr:DUF6049 family protein [Planotetraspora kaengkrachanensis]GIG81122.1 hypothetical protein Pka01_42490 [Planotetraspora kaengkrachanensis]
MIRKAALLTLLTTALLVPPSMAGTADAAPRGLGKTAAPAAPLLVGGITPDVPREPTTPILISGTVTGSPMAPVRIRVHYSPGQPFRARADMARFAAGQTATTSYNTKVQYAQLDQSGKLAFQFSVTPLELGMNAAGVYPFGIEVLDGNTGQQIAIDRTFLTYVPQGQQTPKIKLAVALPLVDRPHRADDTTFMDDDLHTSISSGRLAKLLQLAQSTSKTVTWFLDPAVLDDARKSSAGPYTVEKGDKDDHKAPDAAAAQWFEAVRTALADKPVIATPYGDPDVTALVHNGLDAPAVAAIQRGAAAATAQLGREVPASVVWPSGGATDRDAVDELATAGVKSLLLSGDTLPPDPPVTTTPDAASRLDTVSGPLKAIVSDPTLSQILGGDVSAPGSALLARQRFIAETAMIAFEQPGAQSQGTLVGTQGGAQGAKGAQSARTIVAAPPAELWNPDPKFVTALLKSAAAAPWLQMTTLGSIKLTKAQVHRSDIVYTDRDRQAELGKSYLATIRRLSQKTDAAATVTETHTQLFHDAILRLTSSSWRGDSKRAAAFAAQVEKAIDDRMNDVQVTDTPRAVAGSNGQVPVSVSNGLDQAITIRIQVTSDDPKRLGIDVPGGVYLSEQIQILKARTRLENVPVIVPEGGGEATIAIQLLTSEGKRYGDAVHVTVRATGYTGIALVIVGAALTIMLAAVVMRILRRRSRKSFPFSPETPPEPEPVPTPGAAQVVPGDQRESPPT